MKRLDPSGYQRILIIATRQIGDVLCTTPLMRRAREIWPSATIDVLGYERTMGMLKGNPDINDVIESSEHPKWPEYKRLIKKIFRKYDLAIVTQPGDRAHVYGLLAAKTRLGIVPKRTSQNWWKKLLCSHTIALDYWSQHVIFERLKLLDVFQGDYEIDINMAPPGRSSKTSFEIEALPKLGYVVLHPAPRYQFKEWPTTSWAQLIEMLADRGIALVLTGGPDERDTNLSKKIQRLLSARALASFVDVTGKLSFGEIAELLKSADAYVGVDTAVTHMAAATKVRTIALFGPTPPANFGPCPKGLKLRKGDDWSMWKNSGEPIGGGVLRQSQGNVVILQGARFACLPCRKMGCENKRESRSICLESISPQSVFDAIFQ